MIPVKQTILHDPAAGAHGNCLSAVLASLLHMPIESIPVFSQDQWVKDLNDWLRPLGLAYLTFPDGPRVLDAFGIKGLHHEVFGKSKRFSDVGHACVGLDGDLVFDPHPSDDGLNDGVEGVGVFIALRPWEARLSAAGTAPAAEPITDGERFVWIFSALLGEDKEALDALIAVGGPPSDPATLDDIRATIDTVITARRLP